MNRPSTSLARSSSIEPSEVLGEGDLRMRTMVIQPRNDLGDGLWDRSLEAGEGRLHRLDHAAMGPHDALGIARRAAREEHPKVVGRTFDPRCRLTFEDQLLVVRGPFRCRVSADLNDETKFW